MTGEMNRDGWSRSAGVIVAAGRGSRYGAPGKVLLPLSGRAVLAWSLAAFTAARIEEIVVVAGDHTFADIQCLVDRTADSVPVRVVLGGDRRQDSVAAGVAATTDGIESVAIHDGARPLISSAMIDRVVMAACVAGAAIAAAPVTDTLKRVGGDGLIAGTVDRDGLWSAQTPQAFRRDVLVTALAGAVFRERTFTDEAALFEALGIPVAIVPNLDPNPKVTHPGDLTLIEVLLRSRPFDPETSR